MLWWCDTAWHSKQRRCIRDSIMLCGRTETVAVQIILFTYSSVWFMHVSGIRSIHSMVHQCQTSLSIRLNCKKHSTDSAVFWWHELCLKSKSVIMVAHWLRKVESSNPSITKLPLLGPWGRPLTLYSSVVWKNFLGEKFTSCHFLSHF